METRLFAPVGLVMVLAAAAAPAAAAQGHVGIKAGLSFGDISNAGLLPGSLEGRHGFAIGLGVNLGRPIGIGAEAMYAQRGVIGSAPGASWELDYLDVPVYFRVSLPVTRIEPFIYAGPQFSFELQCENGAGECIDTERSPTTYAAVIGTGVRIGGQGAFTIEARYQYGLSDLDLDTVTSDESYRSRAFLVLAGLSF